MMGLSVRSAGTEPLSYRTAQYITTARSPLYKEKQSGSSYRRKTNDQSKSNESAKDIAECLQLSDDCDIIRIKRVRYAGEEPFYLEINYFEQSFVPEVMEHDFSKESLRVFLSNAYQIQWSFAKQKIYSILADREMAELLHIAVGSPLLYIRRISFDKDNHPRECVCTYYRADTYHLEIELAI